MTIYIKDQREDTDEDEVHRLVDIRPIFVSLVDFGANWGGQRHFPTLKAAGDMFKAVPASDAATEDKRAAQAARSERYGIAALDEGANLSYPAGNPTTERLYGDPVNLKYPLGQEDNERDAARIRNALSRFKGNADAYPDDASKGAVYERIVRAALAEDIEVSFDSENALDALLPADLRDRLAASDDDMGKADDTATDASTEVVEPAPEPTREPAVETEPAPAVDLSAQIAHQRAIAEAAVLRAQLASHSHSAAAQDPAPADPTVEKRDVDGDELDRVRKECEALRADRARLQRALRKATGRRGGPAVIVQRTTGLTAPAVSGGEAPRRYPLDYNPKR